MTLHKHCAKCVNLHCTQDGSFVGFRDEDSCVMRDCPNNCGSRMHDCKVQEHAQSVCYKSSIACINSAYGCPHRFQRYKLWKHLPNCPANSVRCGEGWLRIVKYSITTRKMPQEDELDYQIALRDERLLAEARRMPRDAVDTSLVSYKARNRPTKEVIELPPCNRHWEDPEASGDSLLSIDELFRMPAETPNYGSLSKHPPVSVHVTCSLCSKSKSKEHEKASYSGAARGEDSGLASSILDSLERFHYNNQQAALASKPKTCEHQRPAYLDKEVSLLSCSVDDEMPNVEKYIRAICTHSFKQTELADHRCTHYDIQAFLDGWHMLRCPLTCYGCDYMELNWEPTDGRKVVYSHEMETLTFKYLSPIEPSDFSLLDLPNELMFLILEFLDSASLWNLSLVNKEFRDICHELVYSRGIVSLKWTKGDGSGWLANQLIWSFTTHSSSMQSLKLTNARSKISQHLKTCMFNVKKDFTEEKVRLLNVPCN